MEANAIREAMQVRPFKPFRLRLADGRELTVGHPEVIAVAPNGRRVALFNQQDDSMTILEPLLIVSLELSGEGPSPSNGAPAAT